MQTILSINLSQLAAPQMDIQQRLQFILKNKFHLQEFKNQQLDAIIQLVKSPPSDVFCIFPTSAGKSLIYQIATVHNCKPTLIISPLTALMQDQVIKLQQLGFKAYTYISDYSLNTKLDVQRTVQDGEKIEFLFTTPEQIDTQQFKELLKRLNIGLVCVDECHVIFDWGQDFRRSLRKLHIIREIIPYVPMLALTASVTYQSANLIIQQLKMRKPNVFIQSFNRKNIFYASCLIQSVNMDKNEMLIGILQSFINQFSDRSIIIYTFTKKEAENLEQVLTNYDMNCRYYHSEVDKDQKKEILDKWQNDQLKLIIATKAFSMGIDKSSVGLVIHYTLPVSMEDFYQESGRAGRDGVQSYSIVLTDSNDIMTRKQQQDKYTQIEQKISFYYMLKFLFDHQCKRKTLLKYFNSGINDQLDDQVICCDYCQHMKKNLGNQQKMFYNHIFGYQSQEDISSDHINDSIRYYRKQCPSLPLAQLNQIGSAMPQDSTQQEQQTQNTDEDVQQMEQQQLKHEIKKMIVLACKKKMREYAPAELLNRIDKLSLIIIEKGQNNKTQIYQCAKKIEKFIDNKKGCFTYQNLVQQVLLFFT